MRQDRLSEIDDLLELFKGYLTLDDILDQDYSLISDLAEVRIKKINELSDQTKAPSKGKTYEEKLSQMQSNGNTPKSSNK